MANVKQAVEEPELNTEIEKIQDMREIMQFNFLNDSRISHWR